MSIVYRSPRAHPAMLAQERHLSCGAACARELLRRQGVVLPEAHIRTEAFYNEGPGVLEGIRGRYLAAALSKLSGDPWDGAPIDTDPGDIPVYLARKSPLIVMLRKHWVIVESYAHGSLTILDPEPKPAWAPFATEGQLDYNKFFSLFQNGRFQIVEKR